MAEPGSDVFVQACLLLLLRERSGTRPDLVRRMRAFDHVEGDHVEAGAVGRGLRSLVGSGRVERSWHPFTGGLGGWRSYRITDTGVIALAGHARILRMLHDTMHEPGVEQAD